MAWFAYNRTGHCLMVPRMNSWAENTQGPAHHPMTLCSGPLFYKGGSLATQPAWIMGWGRGCVPSVLGRKGSQNEKTRPIGWPRVSRLWSWGSGCLVAKRGHAAVTEPDHRPSGQTVKRPCRGSCEMDPSDRVQGVSTGVWCFTVLSLKDVHPPG